MNWSGVFRIYQKSFKANIYSVNPFRMIGLVDVDIKYSYGMERVTLLYFRSSGTNSGKIEGLWYPIVGVKLYSGSFSEFTSYINYVLTQTTRSGQASEGWLAKSLFFYNKDSDYSKLRGFSGGVHYEDLLWVGETLRNLYEEGDFEKVSSLDKKSVNKIVTSKKIYHGNDHSQRENFERFIDDIFKKR